MKTFWGSLRRFSQIVRVLARHGVAHLVGPRLGSESRLVSLRRWLPMAGHPGPERLRMLFEDIGGTFIKFGQMLALQPDILPIEYCNALFKLLDRVDPFSYSEVERIVTEELGRSPTEIFDDFETAPLATASVGQVHVAWLGAEKVAVKVQRPNVELEFGNDIRMMSAVMGFIRGLRLKPLYWMIEPISEFVGWTREELDYRNEASYSERLRGFADDMPGQYVPKVHGEYTTRRTLVVEFLDGVTLLDYLRAREKGDEVLIRRLQQRGFDHRRFAANVIENFLGNAFRHGIYHADLHPANLMILEDSVVGYIDFGITGMMSHYSRHHLMLMTLALARGDMAELNEEFLRLTVYGAGSDLPGFRAGLERLAAGWFEDDGNDKRLTATFSRIMTEMLHLSRQTDVMPERDIIKYIRSSIAIDGLIIRFAPDFNLGKYLADTCARYLRWYQRGNRYSVERMLDLSGASGRLLHSGTARGAQVLGRLAAGEVPARIELKSDLPEAAALRIRVLQLAGVSFAVALLIVAGPEPPGFGFNLWTVELLFVAAALVLLTGTLRRLVW